MNAVTLPAHFDGQQIVLDEPYDLQPNTRLAVVLVPEPASSESMEEEERADWLRLSLHGLAAAYGNNEPEYTIDMVKEINPEYKGR